MTHRAAATVIVSLILLLSEAACDTRMPVSLASIKSVGPANIETGDVLRIQGEGFVEGPVQVTFDGTLKPSGLKPPRSIRITLEGTCPNAESVEVEMNAVTMTELTDENAVFEGTVDVVFPTPLRNTAIRISAEMSDVRLSLRPGGGGLAAEADDNSEGLKTLTLLGLKVSNDDKGVVVRQIIPGTIAAKSSIEVGTQLESVNGIAIDTPGDLAGMNLESVHEFLFIRPDGTEMRFQTDVSSFSLMPIDEFLAVLLTSAALAFFFVFAVRGNPTVPNTQERPRVSSVSAIAYGLSAVPALLVPLLSSKPGLSFAITIIALSSAIGALVLAAVYNRTPASSRILGLLAHITAPVAAVGIGALFSEAAGIAEAVDVQRRVMFGWQVFDNPFTMLTGLIAVTMLWPTQLQSLESPSSVESISCWIAATSGAALCAAFLFGGWPLMDHEQTPRALRLIVPSLVFAGKTLLLLLIARFLGRSRRSDRRRQRRANIGGYVRAGLLLVSAAGAVWWKFAPLPPSLRAIGTTVALGGVCIATFRFALIMARRFRG